MRLMLIGYALILALGAWRGYDYASKQCAADRQTVELKLVTAHLQDLEAAKRRLDDIDRQAAQRERALTTKLQETQHALKTATRGRPCFDSAALRVLDHATGLQPPDPAGAVYRGLAAAAPDPADEVATDTDVAHWIATAGDYYERCRARIRDIRRYDSGEASQ